MKKIVFLISLGIAAFAGCMKPEVDTPVTDDVKYNAVITANIPETKVAIDNEYTKLSWNDGDKISVLTSSGAFKEFVYNGENGATSAEFKGTLETGEKVAGYAIYPAHSKHTMVDGRPSVYLPAEHAWKEAEVKGPMVATINKDAASFTHAGGLFAFDVTGMPSGAKGFKFEADGLSVNGDFAYGTDNVLKAAEGDNTSVVMTFDALTEAKQMRFHMPVPTGSYAGFTIYYLNANDEFVKIKSATATNVIEAATVKYFTVEVAEGGAWYVTATGSSSATGLSWANATTLSNALAKAEDGDVIYVGAGTYVPDTYISGKPVDSDGNVILDEVTIATGDAQKAFTVSKNVTILGGYPAAGGNTCDPKTNVTILSGNDKTNHVVLVSVAEGEGKVKMSGFTISGAASVKDTDTGKWSVNGTLLDDYSGALAVVGKGTALDLENMTFTANNTVNASAIYCSDATVNVKNCTFSGNNASGNGTVWFSSGSVVNFSDSEISGNNAANGAGLYLYVAAETEMTANVSNVTIKNNTATTYGGGAYIRAANPGQTLNATLDGCTISGNKSKEGAIMKLLNVSGVTIKNTVMQSNTGGATNGGVLMADNASASWKNCDFVGNTATYSASTLIKSSTVDAINTFDECSWVRNTSNNWATMYVLNSATYSHEVVITNSLFDGNSAKGRGGAIYARTTGAGGTHVSCVNTTFHNNDTQNNAHGLAVLAYSGNAENKTIVDMVSCTVTAHKSTKGYYAVYSENDGASINLYNSLIVNNIGVKDSETLDTYNVGAGTNATVVRYNCQNGTTFYGADGKNAGANTFDYARMLGALNSDGVCPLLLPESNPAVTGGMSATELSALASTNVPASVLTKDQLGNNRTGNVIGAYVGGSVQPQAAL